MLLLVSVCEGTSYIIQIGKYIFPLEKQFCSSVLLCYITTKGILNEPFADCDKDHLRFFDNEALAIVKKNMGEDTSVYIGDRFNSTEWNDGFWTGEEFKGTFLDSHYYHGAPHLLISVPE